MIHYTAVLKKQLSDNVLLFDLRAINDDMSTSIVVGFVIVNVISNGNVKSFVEGCDEVCSYKQILKKQCEEMAKEIVKVIQP